MLRSRGDWHERTVLWHVTACMQIQVHQSFGKFTASMYRVLVSECSLLVACLASSSTLYVETGCFSETATNFY
jgi:hypothetical protein